MKNGNLVQSSPGQSKISNRSKLIADCICWKWQFDYCIEAKFNYFRDLNALCGMTSYSFPLPDRSNSSQCQSIRGYHLIKHHHSKQAPAALTKSFRSRKRNTESKITREISIFVYTVLLGFVWQKWFSHVKRHLLRRWLLANISFFVSFLYMWKLQSLYGRFRSVISTWEQEKLLDTYWFLITVCFEFFLLARLAGPTWRIPIFAFSAFWKGAKVSTIISGLTHTTVASFPRFHLLIIQWTFANRKRASLSKDQGTDAKCTKNVSVSQPLFLWLSIKHFEHWRQFLVCTLSTKYNYCQPVLWIIYAKWFSTRLYNRSVDCTVCMGKL